MIKRITVVPIPSVMGIEKKTEVRIEDENSYQWRHSFCHDDIDFIGKLNEVLARAIDTVNDEKNPHKDLAWMDRQWKKLDSMV